MDQWCDTAHVGQVPHLVQLLTLTVHLVCLGDWTLLLPVLSGLGQDMLYGVLLSIYVNSV